MPHFTRQFTNGAPLIIATLGVTPGRGQALTAANLPIPTLQRMTGLIDTGASCTCVDPAIVQALSLAQTGSIMAFTPSTGSEGALMPQYDASLRIYASATQSPLEIPTIPIAATPLRYMGIDALIGRDILAHCILVHNGDSGTFSLAF